MTEGTGAIPTGNYAISLNSPVPTQGAYPYLSDASVLAVQNIDNKTNRILAPASMTYPSTGTTGRLGYADSTTVPTGNNLMSPMTLVNTGGIAESTGFQDITLNAMDYGKVSNPDTTGVTFAGLSTRFPNFEFASPYVYGLVGMRVLVDGYAGEHFKKLYSIERTATPTFSNYNVYERYLVGMDHTYDDQPNLMTFKSTTGSIATDDISTGVRYTNNGDLNLWTSPTPKLSYNIAGAMTYTDGYTSSGFHVSVEMSSKPNIIYDNAKLRAGFVAALSYQFSPDFGKFTAADSTNPNVTIRVPSVGRGLTKIDASPLTQYQMTRTYFDGIGAYALGTPSGTTDVPTIAPSVTNIAIIGLTNRYNALTTDTSGSQKNVNVEGELNRPTLIGNIKQNIATVSRGFGSASAAATAGKHWCSSNPAVPFTTLTTGFDNCTININGEKITFIEGNATIKCSGGSDSNTCMVTDKRAFIVKNGSLYLKSNISTLNSTGDQTAGQLFLGVMNDTGLANVTIADTDVNITSQDKSGWMFIDPKITNIDAFLFAQGPMVSYDANEKILGKNFFYSNDVARTSSLSNQLYINGSILTLNTITGARQNPLECPYIVDNCTSSIAQIFDLTYTRSFRILSKSTMSGIATDTELVPYYKYSDCSNTPAGTTCIPNDPLVPPWTFAKKAGGLTGTAVNTASNTELRSITDTTYQPYPIIIERDLRWNSAPSRLFQVNR